MLLLPMSPTNSMFLLAESREHPMHVGGLALFEPPAGTQAANVRAMLDAAVERESVAPLLRRRAVRSVSTLGQWGWVTDTGIDLGHHVRHDCLPVPGGNAELFELVARLHAGLLDRSRPLWEIHLIEGLRDGRFAVYMKIHHALADGVSAMTLLRRALSENLDTRGMPAPWEPLDPPQRPLAAVPDPAIGAPTPLAAVAAAARATVCETVGLLPAVAGTLDRALSQRCGTLTLAAPKSLLNVPIGGARHYAARSWPIERLRLIAKHTDATINDVVLAMCSGALRTFMTGLDALPADPLIAMVPVSLHDKDERRTGNTIGMLSCTLGTHLTEPAQRLEAIRVAMTDGKNSMRRMSRTQALAMSALGAAPIALHILGLGGPVRPANVMISNVPGPGKPLYWNGARLTALYPLSIPVDGQALNITCTSTDNEIAFGLTACRRSLPRLEPLLVHLDTELGALEDAAGL